MTVLTACPICHQIELAMDETSCPTCSNLTLTKLVVDRFNKKTEENENEN